MKLPASCIDAEQVVELALANGFNKSQVRAAIRQMSEADLVRMAWQFKWADRRHQFQCTPHGQWSVWVMLAGRGTGKTRGGAEWTAARAAMEPNRTRYRHLVAAPTNGDLSGVCFEGDSGLMSVIPTSLIADHNKTLNRIILMNGALIMGIAAQQAGRFRGPQWHAAWADEVGAWGEGGKDPQYAWDMMSLSVRLGTDTRIVVTTTPKPIPLIKDLIKDPATVITSAATHVNLANLAPEFKARIMKYDGTKIGRQEIYAELLDGEEEGIVKRSDLRLWPAGKAFPSFEYIVMSLDTAFTEESYDPKKRESDPSACSVWGGFRHGEAKKPGIMLLDCWEERLGFPDLIRRIKVEKKAKYGETDQRPLIKPLRGPAAADFVGKSIDLIVIENKASGPSVRQQLAESGILTHPYNPGKADKLARLHIVSPLPASGFIWIPESLKNAGQFMSWANPLVDQVCGYYGENTLLHDDLLDTTTQAWRVIDHQWLRYLPKLDSKGKPLKEDEKAKKARPPNPYG